MASLTEQPPSSPRGWVWVSSVAVCAHNQGWDFDFILVWSFPQYLLWKIRKINIQEELFKDYIPTVDSLSGYSKNGKRTPIGGGAGREHGKSDWRLGMMTQASKSKFLSLLKDSQPRFKSGLCWPQSHGSCCPCLHTEPLKSIVIYAEH